MKIKPEKIFLIVILLTMLWVSIGTFFQHKISHDFPHGYFASDAFQHQTRADAIKLQGDYYYEPNYISGGKKDVVGFYPPILYHLTILTNIVSGVEIYDLLLLLVFLTTILAIFIMYSFLETKNVLVAVASLPFMALVFMEQNVPAYTWGHWPALVSESLLVAFIISSFFIEKKYGWVLFGLLSSGIVLTHTSEIVFAVIFVTIFLIADIIEKRKINIYLIKQIVNGSILFLIVSFFYLVIFKFTWSYANPLKFEVLTEYPGFPMTLQFSHFEILLLLFFIGILALFLSFKKYKEVAILVIFSIVTGFINYLGFVRALQFRFFWPIFFALLFGSAVVLLTQPIKNLRKHLCMGISALFLIAFILNAPHLPKISVPSDPGMMNPYHWEAFKWMQNNIEKEAEIYFFRNPLYSATAILRNSQRVHYISSGLEPFIEQRIIPRYINSTKLGDCCGTLYPYRKTFFDYGYYYTEQLDYFKKPIDICSVRYLIIDVQTNPPVYGQYGSAIREELLKNRNIKEAFNNGIVSILKNQKPGENCIGEING
ncbi:MAG: hypothetical protein QW331_03525 [Candidatus Woesearchaeota archaeon]